MQLDTGPGRARPSRPHFAELLTRYLIVALTLPGRDEPIVCIPHGPGGLHRAGDFGHFAWRVDEANDGGRADALVYLARHATGSIATKVHLVGARVELATPEQCERLRATSSLHRATNDCWRGASAGAGLLTVDEALALASRLPLLPVCTEPSIAWHNACGQLVSVTKADSRREDIERYYGDRVFPFDLALVNKGDEAIFALTEVDRRRARGEATDR